MSWKIRDTDSGREWEKESRSACEEAIEDFPDMGLEIVKPGETDGGAVVKTEDPRESVEDLPDRGSRIEDDPLDWMPGHFIDDIQGTPAINRKGYAVLAAHYNIGVKAEPVVRASETEFEFAEFQATAVTQNGVEYSGFGSAHVDRMDGDDQYLLNELAETRAVKRALALATGVGVVSVSELSGVTHE